MQRYTFFPILQKKTQKKSHNETGPARVQANSSTYPLRLFSVCSPVVHRLFNCLNRRTIGEQPVNRWSGYGGGTARLWRVCHRIASKMTFFNFRFPIINYFRIFAN